MPIEILKSIFSVVSDKNLYSIVWIAFWLCGSLEPCMLFIKPWTLFCTASGNFNLLSTTLDLGHLWTRGRILLFQTSYYSNVVFSLLHVIKLKLPVIFIGNQDCYIRGSKIKLVCTIVKMIPKFVRIHLWIHLILSPASLLIWNLNFTLEVWDIDVNCHDVLCHIYCLHN